MADTVTATWGKILISPIQFNTLEIGPFSMTTDVKPGETPEQAFERAYSWCDQQARKSYKEKLESFRVAFEQSASITRGIPRRG